MNLKSIIFSILLSLMSITGGYAQTDSLTNISKFGDSNGKTYLIINSYNENAPWTRSVIAPITYLIAGRDGLRAELFNLNSTLVTDSVTYNRVRTQFLKYYANEKVDYVAFIGQLAFTFRSEVKEMWGDIPMLLVTRDLTVAEPEFYFSGGTDIIKNEDFRSLNSIRTDYNFTTIYLPDYYKSTVDLMCNLIPDMEEFVLFSDVDYYNRHLSNNIEIYLMEEYPGIKYKWIEANEDNDLYLQYYLSHKTPKTGLLISNWFYEKRNALGYPSLVMGALRLLFSSVNPIFTLRYAYLNLGATGGVFSDPELMHSDITTTVSDILDGISPRDIPFYCNEDKQTVMKYPLMKEYGLKTSNCPADTMYIDKPLSFWQKYYWQMIVGTLVLIMIIFVFVRRTMAQKQEIEILKRHKRFVDIMPIPYAKAKLKYNHSMEVVNIEFTSYNEAFEVILEKNREKNKPYILFPKTMLIEKISEMLTTDKPLSFIHHFEKSDTYYKITLCIIDRKKKAKREYANLIDIFAIEFTKSFKDENELRELTQRLDLSLSMANIIPWEWDIPKEMLYFEATDLFRRYDNRNIGSDPSKKDWMAEPYAEYMSMIVREDKEKFRNVKEQILLGNIEEFHIEYRLKVARQGKECIEWMDMNGAVSERDANGMPIKVIGSSLVTTERKNQEMELIEAAEKAGHADKMKTLFVANLSREIRTPLSAIIKYTDLICNTDDANKQKGYRRIITHNNEVLRVLINDMIEFAQNETDDLDLHESIVNINVLILTVGESIRDCLQKGVVLNHTFAMEHCFARIDSQRVSQVLMNLLTTACKYTSEGCVTVGYAIRDEFIHFFVKGSGTDIAYEYHCDIFNNGEDFADQIVDEEDLGLAKSVSLVEFMGGYVGLDSNGEGEGSTYWFNIPYDPVDVNIDEVDSSEVEIEESEAVDAETDDMDQCFVSMTDNPLILVADDVDSNFEMLKSLLPENYEVIHAKNGHEAVDMCRESKPDIVLMDVNMPGLDGYNALAEIRKSGNLVPVIALSSYLCATDRKRILSRGFDDVLSRPITAEAIIDAINKFIL